MESYLKSPAGLRAAVQRLAAVQRTKLLVLGQGIARTGSGTVGVALMGVEPSAEAITSPLARRIIKGRYLSDRDGPWVVIGKTLAERLGLRVGMKLVITTNNAAGELVDELCRVRGIFATGSEEIDGYFMQAPIAFARRVFGLPAGAATQLGVILASPDDQEALLAKLRRSRPARTWRWSPGRRSCPSWPPTSSWTRAPTTCSRGY